jgi:8-oxo-dGTP pyrophosphatase MutT (NUDIX family)
MVKNKGYVHKKYRKGAFCVVYAPDKKPIYLLLHRTWHWKGWEFSKGGFKNNEKADAGAIREVNEETGLEVINLKRFPAKGKFAYDRKTRAERKARGFSYALFSCEVKKGRVKISRKEHDSYRWCSYSEAARLLTRPNQKKCLRIVNNSLKKSL